MPKKHAIKKSSIFDILGGPLKPITSLPNKCVICDKVIPAVRLKALESMRTPFTKYTHVGCSTTTKIKGIYLGEIGTSEIMLCDKVYDDSVRTVFRKAETDANSDSSVNENNDN